MIGGLVKRYKKHKAIQEATRCLIQAHKEEFLDNFAYTLTGEESPIKGIFSTKDLEAKKTYNYQTHALEYAKCINDTKSDTILGLLAEIDVLKKDAKMDFIIGEYEPSKDSSKVAPYKDAILKKGIYHDIRRVSSLDHVSSYSWGKAWLSSGENHRVVNGEVVRDIEEEEWVISINSLEDLLAIIDTEKETVTIYSYPWFVGINYKIIIGYED